MKNLKWLGIFLLFISMSFTFSCSGGESDLDSSQLLEDDLNDEQVETSPLVNENEDPEDSDASVSLLPPGTENDDDDHSAEAPESEDPLLNL